LFRAIDPQDGLDQISFRRKGRPQAEWCNGPAKICQAMGIDGKLNGVVLTDPQSELWIEQSQAVNEDFIHNSSRIGIQNVPEPWRSLPWRFYLR
jgi:DNA-3-methyladenine glycosylase